MTNKKPKRGKKYQGAEAQSQKDKSIDKSEPSSKYMKKNSALTHNNSQDFFSIPVNSYLPYPFDNSYINNLHTSSILTPPAGSISNIFTGIQTSELFNTSWINNIYNSSHSILEQNKNFVSALRGITMNNHLSTSLVAASKISTYAQESLSSFPWSAVGSQIQISGIEKLRISDSFTSLSDNYSDLLQSIKTTPQLFYDLTPSLTKSIPVEFYTGADLLETISSNEKITLGEELVKREILYENEYSLSQYLPKVAPGLHNMWKGAVETFNSKNSDRVRQFVTSIRELFTHLMHILAPNDEIKNWTTDPTYYHNGNPTRKTRLYYICRNISAKPFSSFVDADINSTIQFIDLFQKGTHSIESEFNEAQIMAIKVKAETTLKFILEIEFSANRK